MGGVYIIIADQTLPKGGVSPIKKGAPPPPQSHTSYWISSIGQCSHSVQSSNIGSSLGYHIHTQQGQQNREKANRIGRRPIVYREKATSIGRRPTVYREKANSI